ncbi:DNA polymerase III subunit delta [bacterium]|nr:DNA polymerase III subunit delta [bacterium]
MLNDFHSILKEIEAGKIASVYFFYGEEPYPVDRLIRSLINCALDPATRDFNYDSFSGSGTDVEALIAIASSFPMMAERRVVIFKDIQQLSTPDRNRLLNYVCSPLESTCLILVSNGADRRKKFWSALTEHSVWIEFKPLYDNQAVEWILSRMRQNQIAIEEEAAKLLVQHVGTSLWNLHHELEKLITFAWGKQKLNRDDVLAVVGMSREYNTWEFTDAIARRNTTEALRILSHLMDTRQSPVGLIMDLTRRILILIRLKLCRERQISQDQTAKYLGLRPYFLRLFSQQAEKFTLDEAQYALEALHQADKSVKTGLLDPIMAMTLVVYDLTQRKHHFFIK